jgi:putative nucleotidyltransferase with HDIG domain
MISLEQLVSKADSLGPLPPTVPKLAAVVGRTDSTVDDVVAVIQYDQGLTVDILKFANSAFSASNRTIATIRDAVLRLGGARILEQVMARHLTTGMAAPLEAYGYIERELWRHSVAAACAAEVLGGLTRVRLDGLAFTAALLHDIGKLVLGRMAPAVYGERVWSIVSEQKQTCEQAEHEVFGFTHADVGAAMARAWGLPDALAAAICDHHRADAAPGTLTATIMVANTIARLIGEGVGNEGMSFAVPGGIVESLGLTKESIEKLCSQTAGKFAEVMKLYGY